MKFEFSGMKHVKKCTIGVPGITLITGNDTCIEVPIPLVEISWMMSALRTMSSWRDFITSDTPSDGEFYIGKIDITEINRDIQKSQTACKKYKWSTTYVVGSLLSDTHILSHLRNRLIQIGFPDDSIRIDIETQQVCKDRHTFIVFRILNVDGVENQLIVSAEIESMLLNAIIPKVVYVDDEFNASRLVWSNPKSIGYIQIEHPHIIETYNEMIGGYLELKNNSHLVMKSKHVKYAASSIKVRSLINLGYSLLYKITKGSVVIFSDVGLGLHERTQVYLARIAVQLVRAGVKVIISSNSSTLMSELNMLLMFSDLSVTNTTEYGYGADEFLNEDEFAAYYPEETTDKKNLVMVRSDNIVCNRLNGPTTGWDTGLGTGYDNIAIRHDRISRRLYADMLGDTAHR